MGNRDPQAGLQKDHDHGEFQKWEDSIEYNGHAQTKSYIGARKNGKP